MSNDPIFEEGLVIQTGAIASDGSILVVALEEAKQDVGLKHSHLLLARDGNWSRLASFEFLCVRVRWSPKPLPSWVVLGEQGSIITITDKGASRVDRIFPESAPGKRGLMRSTKQIGEKLYAVGMRHQVFSRGVHKIDWKDSQGELSTWPRLGPVVGFEGVDGFSEEEIYAVGWEGEIALRMDGHWTAVDSPTNVILTAIKCTPNGSAYICGQRGVILRGRGNSWTTMDVSVIPEDYWDIEWHADKLYIASLRCLYTVEMDGLRRVDMGDTVSSSCYHISAAGDYLCSIGARAIGVLDGDSWIPVSMP